MPKQSKKSLYIGLLGIFVSIALITFPFYSLPVFSFLREDEHALTWMFLVLFNPLCGLIIAGISYASLVKYKVQRQSILSISTF